VKSEAKTVDEYISEVPENRQAALTALRELCRDILVGYDEGMAYGMPSYFRNDQGEVAFASQRNYISVYILKTDVVNRHRDELPANAGKGCIRYSSPKQMDFAVIEQMLRETIEDPSEVCA
jgi:uncharacterized protein YdhG (YjbR/CyaY superfamily)